MRILSSLLVLVLAGCAGLGSALGLSRNPPDEFAVVSRPPLTIPPDFTLRPPQPGAARPQEDDPSARAATALFGTPDGPAPTASAGEQALLRQVGPAEAGIRATLDREAGDRVVGNQPLVDQLLERASDGGEPIIDAPAEAARLERARQAQKPLTGGDAATTAPDARSPGGVTVDGTDGPPPAAP